MDLSLDQTAAAMRCAEGTAKSHLARARRSLRSLLAPTSAAAIATEAKDDG
jgi:DNA-directed RNA polymerase specialized sigma24 family protein